MADRLGTDAMTFARLFCLSLAAVLALASAALAQPAKELFGAVHEPTAGAPVPVGEYARGCVAGAVQLPTDGPGWQAMRLSRDRRWGTTELVYFVEALARSAA